MFVLNHKLLQKTITIPRELSIVVHKMPKPICRKCKTTDSFLWRSAEAGHICNDCHVAETESKNENNLPFGSKSDTDAIKEERDDSVVKTEGETTPAKATGKGTRKSTRATRYKLKTPVSAPKPTAPRGRGRRSLFKKPPLKAPTATATVVTSESLFYKVSHDAQCSSMWSK